MVFLLQKLHFAECSDVVVQSFVVAEIEAVLRAVVAAVELAELNLMSILWLFRLRGCSWSCCTAQFKT